MLQLSTGNITSGKKEGIITGYCKYREKPVETTTFHVGQILALAISSDGKILVSCSIRVSTVYMTETCMVDFSHSKILIGIVYRYEICRNN